MTPNRYEQAAAIIGVVGGKKSGKTTTIEILTKELSGKGYKVAVAKHVSDLNFTIDTEGKDTWRYVQSGAKKVVAASAGEIATIEKTRGLSLRDILERCRGSEVVFLEGFRTLAALDKSIRKIVVAKSEQDVQEAMVKFQPILVFTGPYKPQRESAKIPYIDVLKHGNEIAILVEKIARKKR